MALKITAASEIRETVLLGAPSNSLVPNSVFGHFLVLSVEKQLAYYILEHVDILTSNSQIARSLM